MYNYRRMTKDQQEDVVNNRKLIQHPLHEPPHFGQDATWYIITAACYEHRKIIATDTRLDEFRTLLIDGLQGELWVEVRAWVILPNHYHLLARLNIPQLRGWLHRLHNRTSTVWNREDGKPGRRVWYRFADRAIRNEGHYYATINYIHANPIRHGYAGDAEAWPWSSYRWHKDYYGVERLEELRREYPIDHYGEGWDP